MSNRFAIGTANFSQSYGVFSSGKALSAFEIGKILTVAKQNHITTFDTAAGYGDLSPAFKNLPGTDIITKFSVISDKDQVVNQLNQLRAHLNIESIYGVLIHDPQHIARIEKDAFREFVERIKTESNVKHVGISVYTPDELFKFANIYMPSLIQVPLNPLNQTFLEEEIQDFIKFNGIETHARSLFLQGILLNQELPSHLSSLSDLIIQLRSQIRLFKNELSGILCWALSQEFVSKWVVGIMSATHLQEILTSSLELKNLQAPDFSIFKNNRHPLIDPRNWKQP